MDFVNFELKMVDKAACECHKTSWWVINPKGLSRVYIRFITGLWWATLDINLL